MPPLPIREMIWYGPSFSPAEKGILSGKSIAIALTGQLLLEHFFDFDLQAHIAQRDFVAGL